MAEETFEERTDKHFDKLFNILEGRNGDDGLIVKVDRNTQFRKEAQVGLRGSYLAVIGVWIKSLLGG